MVVIVIIIIIIIVNSRNIFLHFRKKETRLPSNLRPNTRECVHLVTRNHFRSRDKDGGNTIRSAVAENPMLHTDLIAVMFLDPELWPLEVLHCENRDFRHIYPVTLTLTR